MGTDSDSDDELAARGLHRARSRSRARAAVLDDSSDEDVEDEVDPNVFTQIGQPHVYRQDDRAQWRTHEVLYKIRSRSTTAEQTVQRVHLYVRKLEGAKQVRCPAVVRRVQQRYCAQLYPCRYLCRYFPVPVWRGELAAERPCRLEDALFSSTVASSCPSAGVCGMARPQ